MAGLLHVILSDFFSRWRPNWLLSAACRKDTIGERIPLLPDYKSLIRRYYSELWNAWNTTALEELISRDIVSRGSIGTAVNGIRFRAWRHRKPEAPDCPNMKTKPRGGLASPRGFRDNCQSLLYCLLGLLGSDFGSDFGSGLLAAGCLDAPCSPA